MNKKLVCLNSGAVRLNGELGGALRKSIRNRLCRIDYKQLVDVFRYRNEVDNAWRCEFWGKNIRGAILSCHISPDEELERLIRETVSDMISTQTADGCISSYPEEKQLGGWDVWGRKYVLLGLIRYYDRIEADQRIPNVCFGVLDHLIKQLKARNKTLAECSWHDGLASSSILGAVVDVYRITGEKRFLDFALDIVHSGCTVSQNIFEAVQQGIPPKDIGNGKAYEMMSCFQGLIQLSRYVENPEWGEICDKFFQMVRERELFITGGGGLKDAMGEFWNDGAARQIEDDLKQTGVLGETCVTATWLHYGNELLQHTGRAEISAALERTIYNAMLGAMTPDASQWTHRNPTPLAGPSFKMASSDQMMNCFKTPFGGHDCCLAQGPEALAVAASLFVLTSTSGDNAWYLNFYEAMQTDRFVMEGAYPFGDSPMVLTFPKDSAYPLYLRVTSDLVEVKKNGVKLDHSGGGWLCGGTSFSAGDKLELTFDLTVRRETLGHFVAFTSGPVVLAQDSRLESNMGNTIRDDAVFRRIPGEKDFRTVFENESGQKLCDYASAGNCFSQENRLQVWIPVKHLPEK